MTMSESSIERTIQQVERLYQTVTGRPPPPVDGPQTPIPPETDAGRYIEEQLDRLLSMLGGPTSGPAAAQPSVAPTAAVPPLLAWEDDNTLTLALDLPGVQRDSVEVSATENVLIIRARRNAPWQERRVAVRACEVALGRFVRVVHLPVRTQPDQISAQLVDGVLHIRFPVTAGGVNVEHKIPVQ
jgi:HSP20 family protein